MFRIHREITKRNFSFGGSFGGEAPASDSEEIDQEIETPQKPAEVSYISDIEPIAIEDEEIPHESLTPVDDEMQIPKSPIRPAPSPRVAIKSSAGRPKKPKSGISDHHHSLTYDQRQK